MQGTDLQLWKTNGVVEHWTVFERISTFQPKTV